jgi:enoyl-CoA hydratase/carnithine racemase
MSEPRLRVERDGPIGRLVLDNPARRNAISAGMWRAIPGAMSQFDADPDVRCIVVRGEGTVAFAAGADISEFEQQRSNEEGVRQYERLVDAAHQALEGSRKPVIALIHGFCVGGGLATALSCDFRYAGSSSQFAIPAARLGLAYGVPGTSRLVATVGPAFAREIMFTGRRFSAEEAVAMGLINRVVPDAELDAFVRETALMLADNAPLTIATAKTVIDALVATTGDFTTSREMIARCMKSEDYIEGRRAFMEKRKPRFVGR